MGHISSPTLLPGPDSLYPSELLDVGGRLMFQSLTPDNGGNELWSIDGTETGTHVIREGLRVYDTPTAIDGVALIASDSPGATTDSDCGAAMGPRPVPRGYR
jgi:hypothetical protein